MGIRGGLISSSFDRNEASNFWNRRLIEEGEKKNLSRYRDETASISMKAAKNISTRTRSLAGDRHR